MLGHPDSGGQCCLGVLAEVAGCTHQQDGYTGQDRWDGEDKVAPERAIEFVGLHDEVGSFEDTTRPQTCLLYTSPSPRDRTRSRMPSSA